MNKIKFLKITVIILIFGLCACHDGDADFIYSDAGISTSGSIAKFYIDQSHLYVIDIREGDSYLSIFNVTGGTDVSLISEISISREVETISKLNNILYLGTTTGVLFYSVDDPSAPFLISDYDHVTGCDPVVSDGDYAYTTLRSGRTCGGGTNFLDIIDISNIESPKLVHSISLTSPYGLAIVNNNLFVGEKDNGMHWYDVEDKNEIVEIAYFENIKAIDFIPEGDDEIIIKTEEAILQYSFEGVEMTLISEYAF